MSQHTTLMLMLACAGLLPACGHLPGPATQSNHAAPPQARIDDSPATRSAAFCKLGKRMQELGDPRAAMAAYSEALLLTPDSADARNGAAVLHAQLGQLETARSMLQALAQETPTARTYNNLGYVLYLQGEYAQAASVLRQSLQLDNGQQPARANLDLAIAALARSIVTVDATAETIAPDLAPAPAPAAPASRLQLTQLQPNIFTLSWRDAPVAAHAALPAPAKPVAPVTTLPRLEVINGNGETGMAGACAACWAAWLRVAAGQPAAVRLQASASSPAPVMRRRSARPGLGRHAAAASGGRRGVGAGRPAFIAGQGCGGQPRAPDVRLASNTTP